MFSHTLLSNNNNSEWLIAFYGYGQSAKVYEPLFELVKHKFNLIVIDIPSDSPEEEIRPESLKRYVVALLEKYNIQSFQSISYSMGGRMNLFLPQYFPKKLTKIILIAPDIGINFWNKIAVRTYLGHALFSYFVSKENVYLNLIGFFHKVGVLNKTLFAFSKWNMRDKSQRTRVYNVWMNTRYFTPMINEVNEIIESENIMLITYFGKHDLVIPKAIYKRCRKAFPNAQHNLIDKDHQMLKPDFFTLLAQELI